MDWDGMDWRGMGRHVMDGWICGRDGWICGLMDKGMDGCAMPPVFSVYISSYLIE